MARHDVVIIGAGNAGVSLAARLLRVGAKDVAVVSPDRPHLFRPLLNYVAGGQATMDELTRSTAAVLPEGCTWIRDRAAAAHTETREVELAGGERVGYQDLVLAPGMEEDLDAVPGLAAAMTAGWSLTAHVESQASAVWRAVEGLRRGRVVFTIPPEPSPCGGTALKPLFLACDHWRRCGVLDDLDVHLVTPFDGVLGVPFVDGRLGDHLRELGVTVHHGSTVGSVDHEERTVTVDGPTGTVLAEVERAFVVPPYRGPDWLAPLAREGSAGLVDIDPETLAHCRAPRVWSLGDAAALDTRSSGGGLRQQVEVLADNIARSRLGRPLRRYDGYTIIPVTVDRRRLMLVEFDRTGAPAPTTSLVDLTVHRRALWLFDRYVEPVIYFHALLRGRLIP
ncbi:NAD(P)/FAD-dependent oxidoreductase [uncultured Serinicoccus sp.]|uniref:NAD(P)/FAD-dependent oxidoreductase n=1 Tax=uncultured Serinicoccus sp. TaxID=735514 RepID=UPI002635C5C0|nr:FAD/NAD(P)-binding oxidoreductase [uncultured Serinicoccus sp.]